MDITMYTDEDRTTSTWLMCEDMARCFGADGHTAHVVGKMSEIKKTDLLVNNRARDVVKLMKMRRYVHYEQMVTLFASHPHGYLLPQMVMMLASAEKWPIICHSPFMHETLLTATREAFSPSLSRKLTKNMISIPFGILNDFMDVGKNDRSKWLAPFNRCDETFKQYSKHRELTEKVTTALSMKGEKITTRFNVGSDKHSHWKDRNTTGYDVHRQPETRKEYIEQLQEHGVFVSTSVNESFGLMYLEMLACGMVGVFLDRPWVRKLLPGYPLIGAMGDLPMMAMGVYNEFDRAKAAVAPTVEKIRQDYMLTRFCRELVDFAEKM